MNINGGSLSVPALEIESASGTASFNVGNAASEISITERLRFGPGSNFTCAAGAEIHMTGSAFENESTDPTALAGLADLTFVFEGGIEDLDPFEVAGEDLGAVLAGFESNFALGSLLIGSDTAIGQLQLVDLFDNQMGWEGSESLYVENLILGAGSFLDLNGLNLYYQTFTDLGGTIDLNGGLLSAVPEPGTLAMLVAGLIGVLIVRRRGG